MDYNTYTLSDWHRLYKLTMTEWDNTTGHFELNRIEGMLLWIERKIREAGGDI